MTNPTALNHGIEAIVEQLTYLVDELEAQRPWITRIPEVQLTGRPMDSIPSLLDIYVRMAEKEWNDYVPTLTDLAAKPMLDSGSVSKVIDFIQAGRRAVVEALTSLSEADWVVAVNETDETVADFAFQITQSDSTFLRTIAERLHESLITFSR